MKINKISIIFGAKIQMDENLTKNSFGAKIQIFETDIFASKIQMRFFTDFQSQ